MEEKKCVRERRIELSEGPFLRCRKLAVEDYHTMEYGESLMVTNRDEVVETLIQHELSAGIIVPDYKKKMPPQAPLEMRVMMEMKAMEHRLGAAIAAAVASAVPKKPSKKKGKK
jgi:hypothetical protein